MSWFKEWLSPKCQDLDEAMKQQQQAVLDDTHPGLFHFDRPLPIGVTQFHEWSDAIIRLAKVEADPESQKFALAAMLAQLPSTEAYKSDAYFANALRKAAVNQTAGHIMEEIKTARKLKASEAVPKTDGAPQDEVLRNSSV